MSQDLQAIQRRNAELADKIYREARSNPHSPYAGKFVGIADGQVVVVADSLDEMMDRLEQIEPDAPRTFSVDTTQDDNEVMEIWGIP